MRIKRTKKGFTLVELVVVIAVIAILASVSVGAYFGITESAKVSADTQIIAQLNTVTSIYKVDNEIESEEDLKEIIESTFLDENYFEKIAPSSANQGNHYWYKIDSQTFVLAKTKDLLTSVKNKERSSFSFESNNIRSNLIEGGYYLLDRAGSLLADVIKSFKNISNGEEYLDVINNIDKLSGDANDGILNNVLESYFATTAYVTNSGVYRYNNLDILNNVSFANDLVNIGSNIYLYNKETKELEYNFQNGQDYKYVSSVSEIYLPDTVASISSFSFHFVDNSTKLYINKNLEEVMSIFKAEATNATVVYNDALGQNEISLSDLDLEYSDKVTAEDYEIRTSVHAGKLAHIKGEGENRDSIYVAYDLGSFSFDVLFDENAVISTKEYSVVVENVPQNENGEKLFSLNNNTITLNYLPVYDANAKYQGTIKVSPVAGGFEKYIDIYVIAIISGGLTIGENSLIVDNTQYLNTFSLNYFSDETASFEITSLNSIVHNITVGGVSCDDEITVTTDGSIFSIENNKLVLSGNYFGTQDLIVKVGNANISYLTKTFKVTVEDHSRSPFEDILEHNDVYLYRIGNRNSIKLSSLFKAVEGKIIDEAAVVFDVFDINKKTGENQKLSILNTNDKFNVEYTKGSTWNESTIKFNGEGIALMEISTSRAITSIYCEVLDGYNVFNQTDFDACFNQNNLDFIILGNFSLTKYDYVLHNRTIFGNGFTIDASTVVNKNISSQHGIFRLNNSTIDNLVVVGATFPEVQFNSSSEVKPYYIEAVRSDTGSNSILNSYISGTRSPIKVSSSDYCLIENTSLDGGVYSNLHIEKGEVTIKDLTTQQTMRKPSVGNENKEIIGLGIYIDDTALEGDIKLNIEGSLRQHNWITESYGKVLTDPHKTFVTSLFDSNVFEVHKHRTSNSSTDYANLGIIYMGTNPIINDDRSIEEKTAHPYRGTPLKVDVVLTKYEGHFYSLVNDSQFALNDEVLGERINYLSTKQGLTKPNFVIKDVGTKPSESSNDPFYYYDSSYNTMYVGVNAGETHTFDFNNLIEINKYGRRYTFNVSSTNGTIDSINNTLTLGKGDAVVTISTEDSFLYLQDGSISGIQTCYYTFNINVKETSMKDAVISLQDNYVPKHYFISNGDGGACSDADYKIAVDILTNLSVEDNGETITFVSGKNYSMGQNLYIEASGVSTNWGEFCTLKSNGALLYFNTKAVDNYVKQSDVTLTYYYKGKNGGFSTFEIIITIDPVNQIKDADVTYLGTSGGNIWGK